MKVINPICIPNDDNWMLMGIPTFFKEIRRLLHPESILVLRINDIPTLWRMKIEA
jgi:hypothetical protein